MSSAENKPRERRIRFVPGQGSFVFAQSRPFHAILKDTGDPRIKKLQLDDAPGVNGELLQISLPLELLDSIKAEATRHRRSATAQVETILKDYFSGVTTSLKENPLDRIFFNIMEAAELTLDAAGPELQKQILDVLRDTFRSLTSLRHGGEFSSKQAQEQLKRVLADLQRLRDIADQEIAEQGNPG